MVKSRLKKSAPECPFECGGGGVNAIWAMPTWGWRQAERCFPKLLLLKLVDSFVMTCSFKLQVIIIGSYKYC